jgi:hypothetical protein
MGVVWCVRALLDFLRSPQKMEVKNFPSLPPLSSEEEGAKQPHTKHTRARAVRAVVFLSSTLRGQGSHGRMPFPRASPLICHNKKGSI